MAARRHFQEEAGSAAAAPLTKVVGESAPGECMPLRNGETAVVTCRAGIGNAPEVVVQLTPQGRPPHVVTRRHTAKLAGAVQGIGPDGKDGLACCPSA
ncbi:MAG: hypothetical protein OEU93_17520 [Rubrivivax sp.]|nr:hypothetical protein [Rubrivivax sp.]